MAHDVFISHSSADRMPAEEVLAALERAGIACWIAPRDSLPGSHYQGSIIRAIRQCRAVVLLLSRNANRSEHVFRELHAASEEGKPIVPVCIDDVEPGDDLSYYLAPLHWLDAQTPPLQPHLARLIEIVTPHVHTAARSSAGTNEGGVPASHTPAAAPRGSLPSAATPFVGRTAELRELLELLHDPGVRLITVTGPGGSGKTRLAVKAAETVATELAHGAFFIPLTGPVSQHVLAQAIADEVGVSLSRRIEPLDELADFLREKQLLLVLDNFDDVMDQAGVLSVLLECAPGVRILVTSRERLNLLQETLLPVAGLDARGEDSEAVRLFVAAARRHDRQFAVDADTRRCVERICTMVGGMPLAIELAAAWVRVLSCADIAAELERDIDMLSTNAPGIPARHRSMRATFDASWRLLSPQEQAAVARLAVLRGAFDRQAAAAVGNAGVPLLRMVLDKSLLTRAGGRFRMLDLVRQFALEQLRKEPGADIETRRRHLDYFAGLLNDVAPAAIRWHPAAFTRIAQSIDEIREAWSFAVATADAPAILRSLEPLYHFYECRGWAREGMEAFGRAAAALAAAPAADAPAYRLARTQLDLRRGALYDRLGQPEMAEPLLVRGLAQARELGALRVLVFALQKLGAHRLERGQAQESQRLQREALALAEANGDEHAAAWSHTHLGNVALARGDHVEATRFYEAGLERMRAEDDRSGRWAALNNLGVIAAMEQRYDEATHRFREGLLLQQEAGNRRLAALLLHNLGCVASDAGDYATARVHLEEAFAANDEMGYQGIAALSLATLAEALQRADQTEEAHTFVKRALLVASRAQSYQPTFMALLTLARLHRSWGDSAGAARIATLVRMHPASEDDPRRQALEIIAELGQQPPDATDADVGLELLIAEVLSSAAPGHGEVATHLQLHHG